MIHEVFLTSDAEGSYLSYVPDYAEECKEGLASLDDVKKFASSSEDWLEATEEGDRIELEEGIYKVLRNGNSLTLVGKGLEVHRIL